MSEQKCAIPGCQNPWAFKFREVRLCNLHLEMAKVWEYFIGGLVRIPAAAEMLRARGTRDFAMHALDQFVEMGLKYGAIDLANNGNILYECRQKLHAEIRRRHLKIWIFGRGSTLYLVRDDVGPRGGLDDE